MRPFYIQYLYNKNWCQNIVFRCRLIQTEHTKKCKPIQTSVFTVVVNKIKLQFAKSRTKQCPSEHYYRVLNAKEASKSESPTARGQRGI